MRVIDPYPLVRLRPNVEIRRDASAWTLAAEAGSLLIQDELAEGLATLLENPLLWRDIDDLVRQSGVLPRAVVNAVIRELEKISGIDYGFSVAGQICCVSPLARTVEWQRSSRGGLLDPNRYVFFKNGKPSLASPLVQFIITDFPPQVLTAFAGEWASLDDAVRRDCEQLFGTTGFFRPQDGGLLRYWDWHDLIFHRATMSDGDFAVRGATYRGRGDPAIRSAIDAPRSSATVGLPDPVGALLRSAPLIEAIAGRRSCTIFTGETVSLGQISALLHYVAGKGDVREVEGAEIMTGRVPAAGSLHEISFYLSATKVADLPSGIYFYDGLSHSLHFLEGSIQAAEASRDWATAAWGDGASAPCATILFAARLPRLGWKYEGIAYRLALLDAGVLLQTLYLVSGLVGLGGCAVGTGQNEILAGLTGRRFYEETVILQFGFGVPAAE
jgi:SagB-type dehydrogenase family enzyme